MSVNDQLKNYFEENGIKQVFVSQRAGLTPDTISKILNKNRKITADEFLAICDALNVDPRRFSSGRREV